MTVNWRHSILFRTVILLLASFLLFSAVTVAISVVVISKRQHHIAAERLDHLLDTVERTTSIACFVQDEKLADEVAQGLLKNKEVLAVTIYADKQVLASRTQAANLQGQPLAGLHRLRNIHSPFDAKTIIGSIRLDANTAYIEQEIRDEVYLILQQIFSLLALLTVVLGGAMLVFIVRPIQAMSDGLHHMDATRGERLPMPHLHADTEIGRLAHDINGLAGDLVSTLDQERGLRQKVELEEKKYHSIFESVEAGIFIVNRRNALTSWNPAFAKLMGIETFEDLHGDLELHQLPWREPEHLIELTGRCMSSSESISENLAIRSPNGESRWLNVVLSPIGDDLLQGLVHDVTVHKEAEASARRLAVTDTLTGVANRLGLEERLRPIIHSLHGHPGAPGFALMLIDLDDFRRINEGHGLPAGDEILRIATSRLSSGVKSSDIVARLAADRFAIVLQGTTEGEKVNDIAERLLESLDQSYFLAGSPIQLHASLGITLCPSDGTDMPTLLRNAELALDRAKAKGGNKSIFFDPTLSEAAEKRRHLENDLHQAIRNNEFVLYFQPIVDLRNNRMAGAEALIRWRHPERGIVPPDKFVPLAEETGLIDDIGLWALEAACAQLAQWQKAGHDWYLSINVSGRQVPDGLPPSKLIDTIQRYGLDPAYLALEITEGVLMSDVQRASNWLSIVRAYGLRIYLDDFGTGYSSLSYLKRFPVNTLKVDKSFIHDLDKDSSDLTLVEAIVAMAGSLGLEVVAEGVEQPSQVALLRNMGCHYAQGYYFSRPFPAEELPLLAQRIAAMLPVT